MEAPVLPISLRLLVAHDGGPTKNGRVCFESPPDGPRVSGVDVMNNVDAKDARKL